MKTNPEMTESAVLAMVLSDMEFLGLIELNPDKDGKTRSSAIEEKPHQAKNQDNMSKKAA
jgi:hypothetical protein